jgi:AraC-like DNA-binding protein
MIKDIKFIITLIGFCLLTCLSAKGAEQNTMGKIIEHHLEILKENPDEIESLRKVCMYYLNQGNFDKAIEYANHLMEVGIAQNDEKHATLYADICLGQAWLMKDSVSSYKAYNHLKSAEATGLLHQADSALCSVYNGLGLYAVNVQKDYPGSIQYFFKGLEAAKRSNYTRLQGILLCNIAGIYRLQKDTRGLIYTQECYNLGHQIQDPYLSYIGAVRSASMLNMKKDYQSALRYTKEAEFLMQQNDFNDSAEIYSLYGHILSNLDEKKEAEMYFQKALTKEENSKMSSILNAYLGYADLLVKYNENEKAIKLLLEGINISTATPSAVFRSDLMLKLSECYEKSGQAEKALTYYKQYKKETDSLFNIEKERAADELRIKYNIERAENEAKQSKLELLQKEKNMQWLLFFLIAIMIASILLYYLYYRKQKLYKAIVRQNKEAIRREHQLKEQIVSMKSVQETTSNEHLQTKYASSSLNEEKKHNLFEALEKLMTEDHIYTDNLLTKDKVAELLGSNRTYLSQIINEQTGKTFTQYINDYRIQDAIHQLSDPNNQISLKALSMELGFNSPTTFYKQFQIATEMTPTQYRKQVIELE